MCKRKPLLRGRGPSDFTSRKWQNQRMSSFRTRNADDKLAVIGYPFQFCLSLAPPPEIGDYEEDYGKPLIVLSTEPAVPTLGRPYSLSQYPTAKHFIGRHRFLQERYGDRTCTQPFLPFLVKEVSPEVDALRDVDHLRWLRNRRGWKPGRRQQRGERRPVPEKLSPLDGLELNMARPRDEKEEDEEALNSTGLGVPKVKAGAVLIEGKVKGCDHRRGCGRPVGFTLLRQIPRTKMTAPLAKMLKRKSTCHRWTPPHSSTKAAPRRGSQKGGGASDHDKDCEEERPPLLPVSLSRPSLLRKPYSPLVEEDEIGQA
ncbi:uncharacterized protein LOC101851224 [Aplysia californica]|uniref:Uncharacterized protein LOC101851224 n=1 Tax=Aplysia californica TaxID=6500 RepID=A0ABM0K501_APLCA|nr:uncharacterized protein LOC101851224 [Aplysia californica]